MASDELADALCRLAPIRCEVQRSEPCGSAFSSRLDSGGDLSSFFSRGLDDIHDGELSITAATSWMHSSLLLNAKPGDPARQPFTSCRTLTIWSQEYQAGCDFCQCSACLAAARARAFVARQCQQQQNYVDAHQARSPQVCVLGSYVAHGCSPARRDGNEMAFGKCNQAVDITYLQLARSTDTDWPKNSSPGGFSPVCARPLRRTSRGGIILSTWEHNTTGKLQVADRRRMAASTSPIPVPSPVRVLQRRAPAAASMPSLELRRVADADAARDEVAAAATKQPKGNFRGERMLRAVMRFYDAIRQERANRPPGRPLEPQRVVVGFDI